jgi:hypothetical protein
MPYPPKINEGLSRRRSACSIFEDRTGLAIFAVLCVFARNLFCYVNDQVMEMGSRKDAKNRKDRPDFRNNEFVNIIHWRLSLKNVLINFVPLLSTFLLYSPCG